MPRTTTQSIRKLKGQRPIVCTTAYDAALAGLADAAGVDLILVGDSVGTTQLGFTSTIPVTLDMMAHHTAAAARANPQALLVTDIPFRVASWSFDRLLDACARLMQECGAQAVKIEGGAAFAPTIARLTEAGVPVMAHIGLLPQRVFQLGGYRKFGKTQAERDVLLDDARAVEAAGAFIVLGEMIDAASSAAIRDALRLPFVGIGCGPHCDGQMLVSTDILGLTPGTNYPSFVKKYADLGALAVEGLKAYADDVRAGRFPE
jgi:3-methyl-2-oxobutanoate hydroxymethyltransferase